VVAECKLLGGWSRQHAEEIEPFMRHYGDQREREPQALHQQLFQGPRSGGLGLIRDLHDLYVTASETHIAWTVLGQAAMGLRDAALEQACVRLGRETE